MTFKYCSEVEWAKNFKVQTSNFGIGVGLEKEKTILGQNDKHYLFHLY